jgi:hypothetical protein
MRLRATKKRKKDAVYSVPVMIILKLKLVMLPALDDADNINVALVDWPALKTVPPRFQLKLIYVFAFDGTQLAVVMESVIGTVPMFLM